MKPPAIVSLLWNPNLHVLAAFAARHPAVTVLSPEGMITPSAASAITQAGGQVLSLDSLLSDEDRQGISQALAGCERDLAQALRQPSWARHWREFPLPADTLAQILSQVSAAQLPTLFRLIAGMERARSRYDLRLILTNEDVTSLTRTLVAWGRQHDVRTVHLSHGVELFQPYNAHAGVYADITAIFGERATEGYRDIGVDVSSLRVTGNPAWDDYARLRSRRSEIRTAIAAEHGLSPALPIVVFGTTWASNQTAYGDEGIHGNTLRMFLSAARQLVQSGLTAQFIVKDRPGAPPAAHEQIPRLFPAYGLPAASIRYVSGEAMPWVVGADVVISMQSNLALEAMMAGTPAVDLLNETALWLGPCFTADSGVIEVEASSLADTLRDILTDDRLRAQQLANLARSARRYNIGVDGSGTRRFLDLLDELLPTGWAAAA